MPKTPGSGRKKKMATCHPDRPNKSYGRCQACYSKTPDQATKARFKSRIHRYKKVYGISLVQYEEMLEKQNYGCAICGRKEAKRGTDHPMYVDHNHKDNVVRGLLCHYCNLSIGHFGDDPAILLRAASYLLGELHLHEAVLRHGRFVTHVVP